MNQKRWTSIAKTTTPKQIQNSYIHTILEWVKPVVHCYFSVFGNQFDSSKISSRYFRFKYIGPPFSYQKVRAKVWILFLKTVHRSFGANKKKLNFCFCRRILENYWQPLLKALNAREYLKWNLHFPRHFILHLSRSLWWFRLFHFGRFVVLFRALVLALSVSLIERKKVCKHTSLREVRWHPPKLL